MTIYDALIIGGGPAGLSTALGLARTLRPCKIFDDQLYRNAYTSHMHNVSTWDHSEPAFWRKKALDELLCGRYSTVKVGTSSVATISKDVGSDSKQLFTLTDTEGVKWVGRTVVFASGVKDRLDLIPGFEQAWGQTIFHCLFCHGFEERFSPSAGVLLINEEFLAFATLMASQAARLAKKITVYANGVDVPSDTVKLLEANNFSIEKRKISKIQTTKFGPKFESDQESAEINGLPPSIHIWFEGSTSEVPDVVESFLVTRPPFTVRNKDILEDLGVKFTPQGFIDAGPTSFQGTNVAGTFAAGDNTTILATVTNACYQGSIAAGGIHHYLLTLDQVQP